MLWVLLFIQHGNDGGVGKHDTGNDLLSLNELCDSKISRFQISKICFEVRVEEALVWQIYF